MTVFNFYQVDIFDPLIGSVRSYFRDLDKVKQLPVAFAKDDCLPTKIEVRDFLFEDSIYPSVEDMICGALNRQTMKSAKKILTWSAETGWLSL